MIDPRQIQLGTLAAAVLSLALPVAATAQSRLQGRVLDSEVGSPVGSAIVRIGKDTAPAARADSQGFFLITGLNRGEITLVIQALGYEQGVFRVFMPDSGEIVRQFTLDFNGVMLPAVVVQARAELLQPRYIDFERRRLRGLGAYFRWDDLKQKNYSTVSDALRTVRGVRIECDQSRFECYAVMARSPNCHPAWYIDGIEVHSFQENTPIRDVYGIEVYRGTGEIPAEFGGSTAGCGVIVMWTKSRPYR
ncbi:MAG TPA: carboxypeptidase-like regulatory domain-containing protein [Gemmatimonadales bacterium]|nr:carboxypeptidase-like regulatory domain-containing protein [Gemmatimonadales bacterium]